MTLQEIKESTLDVLTPTDIAEVLSVHAQAINLECREHPERVKFPFFVTGNRIKIPREGFVSWWTGNQLLGGQL